MKDKSIIELLGGIKSGIGRIMTMTCRVNPAPESMNKHIDEIHNFAKSLETTLTEVMERLPEWEQRIAELERQLKIADYAFDLCHRFNGNSKLSYFEQAKTALKG